MKTQTLRSLFSLRNAIPLALALCLLPACLRAQMNITNVYTGTGGKEYTASGSTTINPTTGTANGANALTYTFTVPAGVTSVKVECWGGGGGGGGNYHTVSGTTLANGGGAGGYGANPSMTVHATSYTITLPAAAGGGPGTSTSALDGTAGSDVSFTDDTPTTVTGKGGAGGKGATGGSANAGATAATGGGGVGTTTHTGGNGGTTSSGNSTSGGGGSGPSDTGNGTAGTAGNVGGLVSGAVGSDAVHSGGAGVGGAPGSTGNGTNGVAPSGGGGGVRATGGTTTPRVGGAGAMGQVIITYILPTGTATKMLTVLPGETFISGSTPTGTPTAQTAGSAFTVDLYAVNADGVTLDALYSGSRTITLTGPTAGTFTPASSTVSFSSGHGTLSVTLKQAVGSVQLTCADGTLTGLASTAVQVNAGSLSKLQVLLPGESAVAGTATGKTGSPSAQAVATPFNATVNAVDANFNVVSSYGSSQTITLTGPGAGTFSPSAGTATTFTSGSASFSVTLNKAAAATLTLSDGTYSGTSASITPAAGSVAWLQILMPGEVAAAGTATGKTAAAPIAQYQAVAFNVTVNAVDANWNKVSTATPQVNFTSDNAGTTQGSGLPADGSSTLVAGTGSFPVTFATSGVSSTVTASDAASTLTASTSASTAVNLPNLFRSANASGGNWSVPATWEESTDNGGTWNPAAAAPTSAAGDFVTIRSGYPVTVDVASSAVSVTVDPSATLTVSGDILTVASRADVHGTLNLSCTNALTFGSGSSMTLESDGVIHHIYRGAVISGGTLTFNGHYYDDVADTNSTIPTATWAATSTCEITGYGANQLAVPGGISQSFGNFNWNCPSQAKQPNFAGALTSIRGDFSCNSGTGRFNFANSGTTVIAIGGNLNVVGGSLGICSGGGTATVNVGGSVTVSNGAAFNLISSSTSTAIVTMNVSNNIIVNNSAGLGRANSGTAIAIHFAKSGTQTFSSVSGGVNAAFDWTVDSGSTVDLGTNVIAGTGGTFTVSSGTTGGLKTAHASGFKGNITVTGTKTFGTTANYTYDAASGNQSADTLLPATVNNLTIANSGGGKVILNQNETVSGTLTVASGANLDLNGKTISTPNAPGLGGALTMEVTRGGGGGFTGSQLTLSSGTLTYGGSLTVTANGSTLQTGDIIPIFSAGGYSGAFTTTNLPGQAGLTATLSGGNISYNGGVTSQPTISSMYIDGGGNLIISGTNGTASGTYSVLTSTNVEAPLSTWVTNMTGSFSGGGSFSNSIPVSGTAPQMFFNIKQP